MLSRPISEQDPNRNLQDFFLSAKGTHENDMGEGLFIDFSNFTQGLLCIAWI